jgi:hypothetical protein
MFMQWQIIFSRPVYVSSKLGVVSYLPFLVYVCLQCKSVKHLSVMFPAL